MQIAAMSMVTCMVLLATLLMVARAGPCPKQCHCTLREGPYCDAADSFSVKIEYHRDLLFAEVSIVTVTCKSPSHDCSGLPQFENIGHETVVEFLNCSTSILACVRHIVPRMPLHSVQMYNTHGPMTTAHVSELNAPILAIHLSDAVTLIPFTVISSLPATLETLAIGGGNLRLAQNSSVDIQLPYLNTLILTRNFFSTSVLFKSVTLNKNILDLATISNKSVKALDTYKTISSINVMPSVKKIVLKEWNLNLSSSIFSKLSSLEELELIRNNLTSLHADSFKGLSRLKSLLSHNNIEDISPGAFKDLKALEKIHLLNDNGYVTQSISRYGSLKLLCMENIALKELRSEVLQGLEQFDVMLIYDNKANLSLDELGYFNLQALRIMVLSKCNIYSLPLYLFSRSNSLEELIIDRNFIQYVPRNIFHGLFYLVHLNLSNNKIKAIPESIFADLIKLQVLDLSGNEIVHLKEFQFPENNNLISLNLSRNRITSIISISLKLIYERYPYINKKTSPFKGLTQLDTLDLSFNKINSFYDGWQLELLNIKYIDLSFNLLTNIKVGSQSFCVKSDIQPNLGRPVIADPGLLSASLGYNWNNDDVVKLCSWAIAYTTQGNKMDFYIDFSNLEVQINLSHNNITTILLDPRTPLSNYSEPLQSVIILDSNPIRFDCNSYGLYRRLMAPFGLTAPHEPRYVINRYMNGKTLADKVPNSLVCELIDFCHDICTRCMVDGIINEVIVKCPTMPTLLPFRESHRFPYIYFEKPSITVELGQQPLDIQYYDIHKLNLSFTGISNITFMPSSSLKVLDISHNNLSNIPDEFFEKNIVLYISYNPIACECDIIKKIREYQFIGDFDQVTCSNGEKIKELELLEYCNKNYRVVALTGSALAVLICCVLIGKAIYAHSKDIRRFIMRLLRRPLPTHLEMLEMRLDAAKTFDLFISFAHEDAYFVTDTLLPKLESEYNQSVCVHSRDWIVGDLIADQIIQSVENSRRTIIILTEHFILSEWSYLEFRTAHNLSIQEGKPRVILILLNEDIVNDVRLRRDIKSYIAVNTYLLWGDPKFWDKLKTVVPRQGRRAENKT